MLPFPTFQYRGKILRANDRDGAHAYLLRGEDWIFELSGAFYPPLDSSKNDVRRGMENIPWMFAVGPQFVYSVFENFKLRFGIFQATTTNFQMTRFAGELFEGMASYFWYGEHTFGRFSLKVRGGTKEFMSTYFQVSPNDVTPSRFAFEARDGLLNEELAYYQAYKTGRASIYIGAAYEYYGASVNRDSPLHKADSHVICLAGVTYTLGTSSKKAVPEDDASGVIDQLRK